MLRGACVNQTRSRTSCWRARRFGTVSSACFSSFSHFTSRRASGMAIPAWVVTTRPPVTVQNTHGPPARGTTTNWPASQSTVGQQTRAGKSSFFLKKNNVLGFLGFWVLTHGFRAQKSGLLIYWYCYQYTVSGKKVPLYFFAKTLSNPNRSSKFFYRHTQQ